eukprot:403362013
MTSIIILLCLSSIVLAQIEEESMIEQNQQSEIPNQIPQELNEEQQANPEDQQKSESERRARDRNCAPNLPHLSVGDVNLTAKNYEKFKRENEVFILGISDNQCDHCCFTEGMLDSVLSSFQTKMHTYNGKRIKVARLDLYQKLKLSQKDREAFETVPRMLVYKDGEYYPYESYYMKGLFLHFINRVLYPVVNLKTEDQIDLFLDSIKEFQEFSKFYPNKYEPIGDYYGRMSKHVRVIGFFHDKKEYANEMKLFKQAAQSLVRRDDLRVGLVTNKTLVMKYKEKFGLKWFDEFSHNTIVLEREPGVYIYYDLEKESMDIAYWINKMSLNKIGEELTRETDIISRVLNEARGILFIDRNDPMYASDSKVALSALQRISPFNFENRLHFFYVEKSEYQARKSQFGIIWSHLPAFTLITPKGNYFPIDMRVNLGDSSTIDKILNYHIDEFKAGRLTLTQQDDEQRFKNRDFEFIEKLSNVRTIGQKTFRDTITSPDHDVLVYVYTSDMSHQNWKKCSNKAYDFDLVSLKLREAKVKSVLTVAYDVYLEGMNAEIDDMEVPAIYLFPAKPNSEEFKVKYPKQVVDFAGVYRFLKKNAEKKIKLPKDILVKEGLQAEQKLENKPVESGSQTHTEKQEQVKTEL